MTAPIAVAAPPASDRPVDQHASERIPAATVFLSLGIGAEIFSGHWGDIGIPGALDRVLFVLGFGALILGGVRHVSDRTLRLRPVHLLLLVAATYATASSIAAQTFQESAPRFALLDRFGLVPFAMFCVAPIVFGRPRQRRFLLGVLIAVGAYIAIINFFEGIGLDSLIFPRYITDPLIGIHYGRARGPFTEAVADGLALYMCVVAGVMGMFVWRRFRTRLVCGAVVALGALGILLTVTRAVWIGGIAGTLVAILVVPRARRYFVPVVVVGVIGVLAAFAFIPGLNTKVDDRVAEQLPIYDRYNTNEAAIRMTEARPLFGFGWQTFETVGPDYLRQADTYPLTGAGIEVHNVFLSHLAELGIIGALLWAIAVLLSAVGGAIVRRGPPELQIWRAGLLAIFIAFLVVANLGPLSYPFPNVVLWTWAGVAGAEFFLSPRPEGDAAGIDAAPPIAKTGAPIA